ncbi:hypothetical protein C8F01DRAFT_1364169 [Mycena amicta]|nr:hypothetical protein C8F01DRAFT_1364169 [Mycena amicta]
MKYLLSALAVFSFGVASIVADVYVFDLHPPSSPNTCMGFASSTTNALSTLTPCFTSLPTGSNPPTQGFTAIYPTSVAESGDFGSVAVNFVTASTPNLCLTVPSGDIDDGVQVRAQTCLTPVKNRQLWRMLNGPTSGTVIIQWDTQGKCLTNAGTMVTTVDCNGSASQVWAASFDLRAPTPAKTLLVLYSHLPPLSRPPRGCPSRPRASILYLVVGTHITDGPSTMPSGRYLLLPSSSTLTTTLVGHHHATQLSISHHRLRRMSTQSSSRPQLVEFLVARPHARGTCYISQSTRKISCRRSDSHLSRANSRLVAQDEHQLSCRPVGVNSWLQEIMRARRSS